MMNGPLVSIGLPVFNQGRYVEEAIKSILAQTFRDFELIIYDNASTDCTPEICSAYASKDPRVHFFANEQNTGIANNYNRVFRLARGKYFHWTGGDDSHDPRFLQRSVEAMEAHPDHVLCHSKVKVMDEDGDELAVIDNLMPDTVSERPAKRMAAVVFEDPFCHSVFGLFPTGILRKTDLIGNFHNSDRVLVAQVALQGRFLHIPETLFFNRDHPSRYSSKPDLWYSSYDTRFKESCVTLPHLRAYVEYGRAVRRFVKEPRERRECYRELARWWLRGLNWKYMAIDLMTVITPGLVAPARALKQRFLGVHDPFGRRRRISGPASIVPRTPTVD